jgi:uncharacterized spore protein YtfJ
MADTQASFTLDKLGAIKDVMAVSRAFGESYTAHGTIIIPVATVRGGGGGGGGTGKEPSGDKETGSGAGLGFGATVRPIGYVVIKGDDVSWQPTIDVMRIVLGGQLLALAAILTLRRLIKRH